MIAMISQFNVQITPFLTVLGSGRTGSENKNRFLGALKPNKIQDFGSLQRYDKKFYASVHELHYQ